MMDNTIKILYVCMLKDKFRYYVDAWGTIKIRSNEVTSRFNDEWIGRYFI